MELQTALRTELTPNLRAYTTLLPLQIGALDSAIEEMAQSNPWLEIRERPLNNSIERYAQAAALPSLGEHLELQLAADASIPDTVRRVARFVIGSLDEHAYLREDIDAVAALAHVDSKLAEAAVTVVQHLGPAGVAARSLGERFRIQLIAGGLVSGDAYDLTFALDELAELGPTAFAVGRDIAPDDLQAALTVLRACDSDPTRDFAPPLDRIFPEVVIEMREGRMQAHIDDRLWPVVSLTSFGLRRGFSQQMRQAKQQAQSIVDALSRRRTTLERLAAALIEHQQAFFRSEGDAATLVPLSGRKLALAVGCSESTVSRALQGRYAATPFGTITLRSLLVRRPGSVDVTARDVRAIIREIAERSPHFSDEAITRALKFRGVRLARRTVAKYRKACGLTRCYERRRA